MNWDNLKENKCPNCGFDFMHGLMSSGKLMHHPCGFSISEQKYTKIVSERINKRIDREHINEE